MTKIRNQSYETNNVCEFVHRRIKSLTEDQYRIIQMYNNVGKLMKILTLLLCIQLLKLFGCHLYKMKFIICI